MYFYYKLNFKSNNDLLKARYIMSSKTYTYKYVMLNDYFHHFISELLFFYKEWYKYYKIMTDKYVPKYRNFVMIFVCIR